MRKITEYRIQEYLDEHNMAFFVSLLSRIWQLYCDKTFLCRSTKKMDV